MLIDLNFSFKCTYGHASHPWKSTGLSIQKFQPKKVSGTAHNFHSLSMWTPEMAGSFFIGYNYDLQKTNGLLTLVFPGPRQGLGPEEWLLYNFM